MREEYREKRDFVRALETAIKADRGSYVKSINYEYRENDLHERQSGQYQC